LSTLAARGQRAILSVPMDDILAIASRFDGGPSATALVCPEIMSGGAPILCVCRKNNVWQFLCGRDHSAEHVYEADGDPRMTNVMEVVARDPSVAHVATMHDRHIVRRRSVADPWTPDDDLSRWWI
jgi:hypothetical protein